MDAVESLILETINKCSNAREKLPEVLSKQKKKFLIAIEKNSIELEFTAEDEEFVKKVMQDYNSNPFHGNDRMNSLSWDDSDAVKYVNSTIAENAYFELSKYLDCSKIVFLTYSGTRVALTEASKAAEYVLTHARRFGDPSKTIFQIDAEHEQKLHMDFKLSPLPDSKFMKKISHLIEDLRIKFDEIKYQTLNVNATYITLLMLRRVAKSEAEFAAAFKRIQTHDSYVKLCPWPLDNQLPKCDTSKLQQDTHKRCVYLAVQAYLNIEDERTKRVLKVTCMQYLEWNGLQLPNLYFKVVELYGIEEGELWDHLITVCHKTTPSLVQLANEYHIKYEALKSDPSKTQHWFPYCRALNGNYHKDLSAQQNKIICMILAYLVDLKIGFDKSSVRLSHWAKSNGIWQKPCEQLATKIHDQITN